MPASEKVARVTSGGVPAPGVFSALRSRWKASLSHGDDRSDLSPFHRLEIDENKISPELRPLIDLLRRLNRRILVNAFLRGWTGGWNWILLGLILAALLSVRLVWAEIAAVLLVFLGAGVALGWARRTRPSLYQTACRLDLGAGLHDRLSTALFLGQEVQPEGLILRQRQDAMQKLPALNLQSLFPIRIPLHIRRTSALALVVAVLFVYRLYYRPPVIALLESTNASRLVRSILSPIRQDAENVLQRATGLLNQNAEAMGEEKRPAESVQSSDDLLPPGRPAAAEKADSEGANGDGSPQDSSSQGTGRPSLNKSLLDALRSLFANQPPPENLRPQDSRQDAAQVNNPGSANPAEGGDQRDSQQGPDSQQKNPQGTANGAGDQQAGTKELRKNATLSVKPVPDRVPLQSTNLKDQPRVDASAEAGTAKIAAGNAMPQPAAGVNGASQEDIPARYRSYVQRYFEHPDNGQTNGRP